jgi:hypothetical protein
MKPRIWALTGLLVLGILVAPNLEPLYGASKQAVSAQPQGKSDVQQRADARRQKNKKFIAGMNRLPGKIEALMKRSPDFSGS